MHGTTLATRPFFSLTCHPECGGTPPGGRRRWLGGGGQPPASPQVSPAFPPHVGVSRRYGPSASYYMNNENIETVFEVSVSPREA